MALAGLIAGMAGPPLRMMRIYVAGSWPNRDYIKQSFITPLSKTYEITHDWTIVETGETVRTRSWQRRMAEMDLRGVSEADVVVAIMNEQQSLVHGYRGTFCEIGAAIGQRKPVLVFCPLALTDGEGVIAQGLGENVFLFHPGVEIVGNRSAVFERLRQYAQVTSKF